MFRFVVRAERAWSSVPYVIRMLVVVLAVAGMGSHTDPFRWN